MSLHFSGWPFLGITPKLLICKCGSGGGEKGPATLPRKTSLARYWSMISGCCLAEGLLIHYPVTKNNKLGTSKRQEARPRNLLRVAKERGAIQQGASNPLWVFVHSQGSMTEPVSSAPCCRGREKQPPGTWNDVCNYCPRKINCLYNVRSFQRCGNDDVRTSEKTAKASVQLVISSIWRHCFFRGAVKTKQPSSIRWGSGSELTKFADKSSERSTNVPRKICETNLPWTDEKPGPTTKGRSAKALDFAWGAKKASLGREKTACGVSWSRGKRRRWSIECWNKRRNDNWNVPTLGRRAGLS